MRRGIRTAVFPLILLAQLGGIAPAGRLAAQTGPDTAGEIPGGNRRVYSSEEQYLDEAETASLMGNLSGAIRILEEGMERFPDSTELPGSLGDVYLDRELYSLAWEAYRRAETRGAVSPDGPDVDLLERLAYVAGTLNREQEAIGYFERVAAILPDHPGVTSNLAWLYFKTRQLERGERILLEAMERYGSNRDLSMTLATIYGESFRYEEAERFYMEAIDEALRVGDFRFGAVTAYNLSLLHLKFYRFPEALDAAELSRAMEPRAPGHMALGELHRRKMDFPSAQRDFLAALEVDDTPLARLNLAVFYRQFGLLDHALAYIEEAADDRELHWLYNYGTDADSYSMNLHRAYADIYGDLSARERMFPKDTAAERIASWIRTVRFSVLSFYHEMMASQAGERVGRAFLASGNSLNGAWQLYRAYRGYPSLAIPWLREARERNVAVVPESLPFYRAEEGTLREDPAGLRKALTDLDPVWERHLIADVLVDLVRLLKGSESKGEVRSLLSRLYSLNPGAFPRNGLGLPVILEVGRGPDAAGGEDPTEFRRDMLRVLREAGFDIARESLRPDAAADEAGYRYTLRLSPAAGGYGWSIREIGKGNVLSNGLLDPPQSGRPAEFARRLIRAVFGVEGAPDR